MRSVFIKVQGRVQGVFFRQFTKEKANQLGVVGTVRNCKDGSVEIEAEADDKIMEQFIAFSRRGPERASVTTIDIHEVPLKNFTKFEILR